MSFGQNKSILSKPIADAYKLYAHFLIVENSGLVGIPITIFVYLVEIILASSIFYVYFLKIHNNGRLLDTYHRLHGAEEDFLVPYDQEISAKVCFCMCLSGHIKNRWKTHPTGKLIQQKFTKTSCFFFKNGSRARPIFGKLVQNKAFGRKIIFHGFRD